MAEPKPPAGDARRLPNGRFPKGVCGNPGGRPKGRAATVDFEKIVDGMVPVKRNGRLGAAPRKEAALSKHLAIAMDAKNSPRKRLRTIAWLLDQFYAHGALKSAFGGGGALQLPSSMPWEMALWMARKFGAPPFEPEQIAVGRKRHLATRSAEQAEIDRLIAYPDLIEDEGDADG